MTTTKIPQILREYFKQHNKRNTEVFMDMVETESIIVTYRTDEFNHHPIVIIQPNSITFSLSADPTPTQVSRIDDVLKCLSLDKLGWHTYKQRRRQRYSIATTPDAQGFRYSELYNKSKWLIARHDPVTITFTLRDWMIMLKHLSEVGGVHPYTGEYLGEMRDQPDICEQLFHLPVDKVS